MSAQKFLKEYKKLNTEQKRAVDAIEGPVMVIAGPGTGKTTVLTLRIANILRKTDTTPDSILALTFTESGVVSMRKNLVDIIGSSAYRVHIHTFHGFCNEVIQRYPDEFPRIIGANPINDIEKISLLKEVILSSKLKRLRPFGDNFYYLTPLKSAISELKREDISPKFFKTRTQKEKKAFREIKDLYYDTGRYEGEMKGKYRARAKQIEKLEELLKIYVSYENELQKRRLYDYEDMIVEAVHALETNSDLLLLLQEEYHYILADEHQDANNSQNHLLELLSGFHDNPNLFIVGDEKQAIFRFQGASLENFYYFKRKYPLALRITLTQNYRSTQSILDSSHTMISHASLGDNPTIEMLHSQKGRGVPIELRAFSKQEYEHVFLIKDIEKKIASGVEPSEIAVLYRTNRDAEFVVDMLEKTTIPFILESSQNIFSDIDIQKFVSVLRAVESFGNDASLLPVFHVDFLGLSNLDVYRICRFAEKRRISIYKIISSSPLLKSAGIKKARQFKSIYGKLSLWKTLSKNKGLLEFLEIIVRESGFLTYILREAHTEEKLGKLTVFIDTIKSLVGNSRNFTLSDLIEYFDMLEAHDISVDARRERGIPKGVRLMTAHRSKGLEFEHVYIVGLRDGHWGNRRNVEHFPLYLFLIDSEVSSPSFGENEIGEERRLFYVALTRAKSGVYLSYAKEGTGGKIQLPSQFVEEIDEQLLRSVSVEKFEGNVRPESFFAPKKSLRTTIHDKEFLRGLFETQGLSVTALNNYLLCPWNYFYNNLLRVPRVPNKHLMFGNAAHKTLRHFFDKWKEGDDPKEKGLLSLFEEYLKKEPLSDENFREAYEKGSNAFRGYYARYRNEWTRSVLNEYSLTGLLSVENKYISHLRLRGVLDKVEILNDLGDVNIVDYKTGKPKSRNIIEGKTKTSKGDYKRQLVFYKLLLELMKPYKFEMVSGEIDFIESDDKGCFHKEKFEIITEDVQELKELLEKTANDITALAFWKKRCDNKKCDYCTMRDMMTK